ncbi:hypothetical protein Slin15195_G036430 [Septoria linicola]|uniref:Uncharacterized protein n=1 Tax=Septoria linicola TaxID=215465 RepID=A0A9Q9EHS5_9PEZI|nr:hypothetical protein Slin15195_G036430 [Septoria linicola]
MSASGTALYGDFRYIEPDESIPAEDRCLYNLPPAKIVKDIKHKLHDIRTSTDIAQGKDG